MQEGKGPTALQSLFLSRLERLLHLSDDPALVKWQQDLVKRAIYSTYLDCLAVGMADEARVYLPSASIPKSRAIVRI